MIQWSRWDFELANTTVFVVRGTSNYIDALQVRFDFVVVLVVFCLFFSSSLRFLFLFLSSLLISPPSFFSSFFSSSLSLFSSPLFSLLSGHVTLLHCLIFKSCFIFCFTHPTYFTVQIYSRINYVNVEC